MKIARYQGRYILHLYRKSQSLYIAEAGLQHKMNDLMGDSTGYILSTAFGGGYYRVSVINNDPYYLMISTGDYGRHSGDPEKTTVLTAEVQIYRGGGVLRVGRKLEFQNVVHIYGDIYANDVIDIQNELHMHAKGEQSGSIFVTTDAPAAVKFQNNIYFEDGNQYIKTRGNSSLGSSPYEHAPLVADNPASGVYNEALIQTPGNVTIVERDNSDETEPFELIPLYNLNQLSADVTYDTRQSFSAASPLNLDDKVHLFRGGVDFGGDDSIIGKGTVWVDGTGDAEGKPEGIKFQAVVGALSDYRNINLIVTGGTWDNDIKFQNDVFIEGYIYAEDNIQAVNEFRLKGAIEIKSGDGLFQNEVHIEYSKLIGFLPIEGGGTNTGVRYLSWKESTFAH